MRSTKYFEDYWKNRRQKDYPVKGTTDPDEIAQINWIVGYWNINHPSKKKMIEILKRYPPRSVLEIGCGAGVNLFLIKQNFPGVKVAGCDINRDAILAARRQFCLPPEEIDFNHELPTRDVELRVGAIDNLPFHGESFDLVLTNACMIYVGLDKMARAMREIRRVGYDKMMFIEWHTEDWLNRLMTQVWTEYNVYDYKKLLTRYNFKRVQVTKITKEDWPDSVGWQKNGNIITCVR